MHRTGLRQWQSSSKTVTLLVDRATTWTIRFTGGLDAIQVAEGSSISAEGVSTRSSGFHVTSTANLQSVFANQDKTGAANADGADKVVVSVHGFDHLSSKYHPGE